jgi:hypothetical protein
MPSKPPPKAHEMTTEQAAKALFPKKAREAVRAEAERAKSPTKPAKRSTK